MPTAPLPSQPLDLALSALLVLLPGLWLAVALLENLRHPGVNAGLVAAVMKMEPLRLEPAVHAEVQGNRVEAPALHRWAFRLVVAAECLIVPALLAGALLLGLAAGGAAEDGTARSVALLAVAGFSALWAALLAGGQWFYYWLPDARLQTTHFLLLLWGVATLLWLR